MSTPVEAARESRVLDGARKAASGAFSTVRKISCALTIAGLDPGGGAGIAADLRAFAAAGAFGCAVVALLTVQSTSGLVSSRPVPSRFVLAQAREVVRRQRVGAIKTGALGSVENVRAVASWLRTQSRVATVVDPVMLPSRGRGRLLSDRALAALRDELLPGVFLVTPNAEEAQAILERRVTRIADACDAALALCALGARAALVKGGHFEGKFATDVLAVGDKLFELSAPRIAFPPLHGGGCVLASLVAGRLAVDSRGEPGPRVVRAVRWARAAHRAALARPWDVGGPSRVLIP
jgi:hydroxymethylpyrimidine/phosphomethylpyrimidine kinase